MSTLDRYQDNRPTEQNKLRPLSETRVCPGLPRESQVTQSPVSSLPPKGRDNTGMKLKSR